MNWIAYAVISSILYTIISYVDKFIITKRSDIYRSIIIYAAISAFLIGTFYWFAAGFPILSLKDSLFVLLAGAIAGWAGALYYEVMFVEEASKFIIISRITPVFVLVLAYILLKEKLTINQFIGFLIILGSAVGISLKKSRQILKLSKTFWIIMIVNLMWASAAVIVKYSIEATSFSNILPYESWGLGLGGLSLYLFIPKTRNAFNKSISRISSKILIIIFINESIYALAKALNFYAFSKGKVSLVSVIGGTEALFAIIIGVVLTKFLPQFYNENIEKRVVLKKIIWSISIIFGIFLIS